MSSGQYDGTVCVQLSRPYHCAKQLEGESWTIHRNVPVTVTDVTEVDKRVSKLKCDPQEDVIQTAGGRLMLAE